MYTGKTVAGTGTTTIVTDIPFIAGFAPGDAALDPDRTITYLNDNTLHAGYYFEGRLTINGIVEALTVIASPDSFGYANLDVSGVLRIKTSLGKIGNYLSPIMKETTKSGKFNLNIVKNISVFLTGEQKKVAGDLITSPPSMNDWYYAECVRSEEQGSNLHEYVANSIKDAPFLNSFERPVYFLGLPFDISFILPETAPVSPASDITVTMKVFNSVNTQIGADIVTVVPVDSLEGFVNSLNIDPATMPANAAYFTVSLSC